MKSFSIKQMVLLCIFFLSFFSVSAFAAVENLRSAQVDPEAIQKYIDNLESIRQDLNNKQNSSYQRMSVKNEQIQFLLEHDKAERDQVRGEF